MGHIFSDCANPLGIEDVPGDEDVKGPKLHLRIGVALIEQSLGSLLASFGTGEEVAVVSLEQLRGYEPLRWRFEQSARERSMAVPKRTTQWPEGTRCCLPRRYWRAQVLSSSGQGGIVQHTCLLQVITDRKDRRMENLQKDIEDARDAASHAHRFNLYLARASGNSGETVVPGETPMVKVSAPVGCFVIGGAASEVASPGDAVLLSPYPGPDVRKFLFDGGEDFEEIPQAFFHYTACQTGGNQQVVDIQGMEDDDGFLIVDPMVLRSAAPGIVDLLGAVVPGAQQTGALDGPSPERFNLLHPRCGGLCKAFDPQRRSAHQKKNCGLSCGVGGYGG